MSSLAAPALMTGGAGAGRDGADGTSPLAALVERAREGDGRAFDRLMLETQERVVGTAWRLLGSREDARDAAQEVYLRVFRHLGRFRPGHDFRAWLYRITVNVCRDAARRRRREPVAAAAAREPGSAPEAEQDLLGAERWSRLLGALAALPPKERAALVLRDLEGLTSEQVARVLGSRPGTVRSQIASARMRIRSFCVDLMGLKGGA
ncbi:MAG TPA: sigma-70 family RNA polymerase sigma factor [Thermoanaerobaculia bacterium]|nr:sigma-70 family RNA polymerase sigma factor [Thermoanaerobaculia bacterium]